MGPNPQETVDLVTFVGEILNGKLYFLCRVPYPYEVVISDPKLQVNTRMF